MRPIEELAEQVAELKRQVGNLVRPVKVLKRLDDGRLEVSDGTEFKTQVAQVSISSGNFKFDAPAEAEAQGFILAPGGDTAQGLFFPSLPSDAKPAATDQAGEARMEMGGASITFKGGAVIIEADAIELKGSAITLSGEAITTKGPTHLDGGGPKVETIAGPAARVFART